MTKEREAMQLELERKKFEVYFCESIRVRGGLTLGPGSSYIDKSTQYHWEKWQAALENPSEDKLDTVGQEVAAGDGTLHGAIDYWQKRALEAEAKLVSNSLESGGIKTTWKAIDTAPKDNKRPLYLAEFRARRLISVDCYGEYFSVSDKFLGDRVEGQDPTHWAYQDEPIPQVPHGFKLVPIEPTEEMISELINTGLRNIELPNESVPEFVHMAQGYKAMLSAAPQPPKGSVC